jgi:hypothetical protein
MDELKLMYKNLKIMDIGGFTGEGGVNNINSIYWSSCQSDTGNSWGLDFSSGGTAVGSKRIAVSVRAVRAF